MAQIAISISITVPNNMTTPEVVRLFTDHHNYTATIPNPAYDPNGNGSEPTIPNVTRSAFAKATIARQVSEAIKAQIRKEAQQAISVQEITVE